MPARMAAGNQVDLRQFMTAFPTGVGVVTTFGADGQPYGMTCTAICSVTLEPPTLLVSLRQESRTLRAVLACERFALNLLDEESRSTAELFSSHVADRFASVSWDMPPGGAGPHLSCAAHSIADCRVVQTLPIGDHTVVFAETRRITSLSRPRPLMYGQRRYLRWSDGGMVQSPPPPTPSREGRGA